MFIIEHSTKEFRDALERLNREQNKRNLFVNITDEDVFREIARQRRREASGND